MIGIVGIKNKTNIELIYHELWIDFEQKLVYKKLIVNNEAA